jgi:hypothetical protein
MKKIIFIVVTLLLIGSECYAQKYSINKYYYNYNDYIPQHGDPYNPALAGIASLIVPGMGQLVAGETMRGLAFMGGYTASALIFGIGYITWYQNLWLGYTPMRGMATTLVGLGGMIGTSIWSIIDAVNVAKVNNMYLQEVHRNTSLHFEVTPYTESLSINNIQVQPVGLTLRVTF